VARRRREAKRWRRSRARHRAPARAWHERRTFRHQRAQSWVDVSPDVAGRRAHAAEHRRGHAVTAAPAAVTVLIIEDNEDNCIIMSAWLGHAGYHVVLAPNGARGVAMA